MENKDIVFANGMQFWGTHGAFQEENTLGQKFIVDVEACYDMSKMIESDDVRDGLSYVTLYKIAEKIVTKEQHKLLQKVAARIAQEVREAYAELCYVKVTIRKPAVPVGGILDCTGVTLIR